MRTSVTAAATSASKTVVPLLAAFALTTACVTINIYFPASAAEKAADEIIDEVWQAQQGAGNATTAPGPVTPAPEVVPPVDSPEKK